MHKLFNLFSRSKKVNDPEGIRFRNALRRLFNSDDGIEVMGGLMEEYLVGGVYRKDDPTTTSPTHITYCTGQADVIRHLFNISQTKMEELKDE